MPLAEAGLAFAGVLAPLGIRNRWDARREPAVVGLLELDEQAEPLRA